MEISCDNCGVLFDRPTAWLGRSKTVCCSRECAAELKMKNSTKECLQCGQMFYSKSHQKEKKYCSILCSSASKVKLSIRLTCHYCGAQYAVKPSRKNSKYCSAHCMYGHRKRDKESILTLN